MGTQQKPQMDLEKTVERVMNSLPASASHEDLSRAVAQATRGCMPVTLPGMLLHTVARHGPAASLYILNRSITHSLQQHDHQHWMPCVANETISSCCHRMNAEHSMICTVKCLLAVSVRAQIDTAANALCALGLLVSSARDMVTAKVTVIPVPSFTITPQRSARQRPCHACHASTPTEDMLHLNITSEVSTTPFYNAVFDGVQGQSAAAPLGIALMAMADSVAALGQALRRKGLIASIEASQPFSVANTVMMLLEFPYLRRNPWELMDHVQPAAVSCLR